MKIIAVFLVVGLGMSSALRTTCDCGRRRKPETEQMIVGGEESGVNEWPSIAALAYKYSSEFEHYCGATIITRKHVLTAAHCVRTTFNETTLVLFDIDPAYIRVVVGAHDWTQSSESDILEVERVMVHENYSIVDLKMVFDIALIKVKGIIRFSEIVGPACYPNARLNMEGKPVTAVGWGLTRLSVDKYGNETYNETNVLRKVDLTAYNIKSCIQKRPIMKTILDVKGDNQICTVKPGKSACKGDSGGPLYWLDPEINRYVIAGVASFVPQVVPGQDGCQDVAAFIDPSAFIGWIGDKLGNEVVCTKP